MLTNWKTWLYEGDRSKLKRDIHAPAGVTAETGQSRLAQVGPLNACITSWRLLTEREEKIFLNALSLKQRIQYFQSDHGHFPTSGNKFIFGFGHRGLACANEPNNISQILRINSMKCIAVVLEMICNITIEGG
jgi:hypothetical protein